MPFKQTVVMSNVSCFGAVMFSAVTRVPRVSTELASNRVYSRKVSQVFNVSCAFDDQVT